MITTKGYLLLLCYLALQHAGGAGTLKICLLTSMSFELCCWLREFVILLIVEYYQAFITGLTDLMEASIIGI